MFATPNFKNDNIKINKNIVNQKKYFEILKERKMKMKKSAIFLSIAAFLSITTFAQNVKEGINDYYAERY